VSLPACVLTDIEGTTTRIAFVRDVLFPYARTRLPAFLTSQGARGDVGRALDEVARLAPGVDPLASLLRWMDEDAKIGPLKTLQGLIWEEGYADGSLKGELYPDVAPALRQWHVAGVRLFVYSSGSVAAQRMLFRHSVAGDLESLFSGFFDTAIGGKREFTSYASIAHAVAVPAEDILFLSDVAPELDAAAAAGLRTCQLVRAEDGTIASVEHRQAKDFYEVEGKAGGNVLGQAGASAGFSRPSPPDPPSIIKTRLHK
jgi:enolase-phosphatase E1